MAYDISATNLAAAAAAGYAKPYLQLLVDWAGDGFDSQGTWTDESAYVVEANGDMKTTGQDRSLSALGTGVASRCTVVLHNPEAGSPYSGLRFSPSNAAGPLYSYIGEGKVRFIRAVVNAGFYYAAEAVGNPGFETVGVGGTDVFANWTEVIPLPGLVVDETSLVHTGGHAAKLGRSGMNYGVIYQDLTVAAGTSYTLSFWTRGTGTYAGQYSLWDNTHSAWIQIITETGVTGTSYQRVELAFDTPAGCTSIRLALYPHGLASGWFYFDDVSVVKAGGGDAQYAPQITGYIVNLTEDYRGRTVTLEIRDRAAVLALMRATTDVMENTTLRDLADAWLDLADRDVLSDAERDLDLGIAPVPYAWLSDEETIWQALSRLAQAHGGRVWFDRAGVCHVEDLAHLVKPDAVDAYQDPFTDQWTFEVDNFGACDPRYDPDGVINHVVLDYTPLYDGDPESVVYEAPEIYVVPPNDTLSVTAELADPTLELVTPEEDTDYYAATGGRENMTSDVAVTVDSSTAVKAELTLANDNTDYEAYFYVLQLRGTPVLERESTKYEAEDSASITQYGRQTLQASNPWIQSRAHAEALAGHVLERFATPPLRLTLRDVPAVPWLEPCDRVTVTETLTGIDDDFFILGLSWTFREAFVQTLDLVRVADLYDYAGDAWGTEECYFVIGSSDWGNADHRLMW